MIQNFFIVLGIIGVSLIPIVLWGYLFSYFDDGLLNRKRFLVGIFAGVVSVVPVLYLEDVIEKTNFLYLDIFGAVAKLQDFGNLFSTFLSFFSVLFLLSFLPFLFFGKGYQNWREKLKMYGENYAVFVLYLVIMGVGIFFLGKFFDTFSWFDTSYDFGLSFGNIVFNSFKLVVFYYLLIAILEELSKFFSFRYSKMFSLLNVQKSVLYAIFVALGFAFCENILYVKHLYELHGVTKDLLIVYFSRNIFSVVLHVLCSAVFSYYFSLMYLKFFEQFNKEFIKVLFVGFFLSVVLHGLFDIFLTFGVTSFIFFYLIGAYFYLTYIFYKPQ